LGICEIRKIYEEEAELDTKAKYIYARETGRAE